MATQSFKEKLTGWEVLNTNLKTQLAELPHLGEDQAALEDLLAEGRLLEARQGADTAALRETNRQRVVLERRGDELRERVAGALRHKFGLTSRRLYEFGIKPKAERRRRPSVETKLRQLELKKSRLELQKLKIEQEAEKLLQEKAVVGEKGAAAAGVAS